MKKSKTVTLKANGNELDALYEYYTYILPAYNSVCYPRFIHKPKK